MQFRLGVIDYRKVVSPVNHILKLTAERAEVPGNQTEKVIALLEEGNTVRFIARYGKEATVSLDEVQIKHRQD